MKVSEITIELVANYLKLDYSSMAATEKAELSMMIDAAKAFIRSYTGIYEQTVKGEEIGTGDGETSEFWLDRPVISGTETIYVNGSETTAYSINYEAGKIVMTAVPDSGTEITGDYQSGLDACADFVIAVYILCQDMWDNRSMYVDKSNLNRVVDTILGMHRVNLL